MLIELLKVNLTNIALVFLLMGFLQMSSIKHFKIFLINSYTLLKPIYIKKTLNYILNTWTFRFSLYNNIMNMQILLFE